MRRNTPRSPEQQDYGKSRRSLIASVVFNTPYDKSEGNGDRGLQRYHNNAQKVNAYQFAGLGFKRAILAMIESDPRAIAGFRRGLDALNQKRREAGKMNVIDFRGFKGFIHLMRSIDTYGFLRGLSPYNLALFTAIFLDETVIDIAQLAANDDDAPSVLCMSIHFLVGGITGLNRALVSAAVEPINHAKKNVSVFFVAASMALLLFTLITFLGADDTVDELAGLILQGICHMIGVDEKGEWALPVQTTLEILLLVHGALTVGSVANIIPEKWEQMQHDLQLVARRHPDWYLSRGLKFFGEALPTFVRSISQHGEIPQGELGEPLNQLGGSGAGLVLNNQ